MLTASSGMPSGTARLGIYDWVDGMPQSLVLDAGTFSLTGTAGAKMITIDQDLERGYYFLAYIHNLVGAISVTVPTSAITPVPGIATTATPLVDKVLLYEYSPLYADYVTAGLPASIPDPPKVTNLQPVALGTGQYAMGVFLREN